MKLFIGTKTIKAVPMTRGEYNKYCGWELPADENGGDAGFLVEYIDGGQTNHKDHEGYISWSPKNVFEKAYRETSGMNFGLAIEAMKKGHKVARSGWNGAGMFAVYQKGYPDGIPVNGNTAAAFGVDKGTIMKFRPHLQLKTAQDDVATWSPSTSDAIADDWSIIE